jgi:transcriptional regulator of acetoin/glycerol metabolism
MSGETEAIDHIERLYKVVEGNDRADNAIDQRVADSWLRSVKQHGLDPSQGVARRVLTSTELIDHRGPIENLLSIAQPVIDRLYQQVSPASYCVVLADHDSVTLDLRTPLALEDVFKREAVHVGTCWSEADEGTCGIGTAIIDCKPTLIHRNDHFRVCNIALTCSAAPIFGVNNELLAVLDASALFSPNSIDVQRLVFQMVVDAARQIEDGLALSRLQDKWVLQLSRSRVMTGLAPEFMLAFDDAGCVQAANRLARDSWPVLLPSLTHLADLFDCSVSAMISQAMREPGAVIALQLSNSPSMIYGRLRAPLMTRSVQPVLTKVLREKSPLHSRGFSRLATQDAQMQANVVRAQKIANRDIAIILQGETGTGKEAFAQAIHDGSDRRDKSFVALNCAALPENLIESELFGYRDGAFTGARAKGAKGKVLQSNGGTLFLDEIGDMPLALQSRLLRVLAENEVLPLGADSPVPVSLRVICATHQNLEQLVADGLFREDLYYRLNGAVFTLPPLREREDKREVIACLLQQELLAGDYPAKTIAPEAMQQLLACEWPGNIRQLRNALRYALAIADGETLQWHDFAVELQRRKLIAVCVPADDLKSRMLQALRQNEWCVTQTARELDIPRASFYRRMQEFGLVAPNRRDQ